MSLDNRVLDLEIVRRDRNQATKGFPFKLLRETVCDETAKRHIIKGIFARGETSAWIGPPGSLKSALMADAAVAIASGVEWFGRRNKEQCGVVYFALERADLVERRLKAMADDLNLPIAIVRETTDLVKGNSIDKVITTIREAEHAFDVPVGLVIFDTWAKVIAAGRGDENQAKDQGAAFTGIQRIINRTDAHVALLGHTGKDEGRGARGSNALDGHVDLMVTISGEATKTATVTKANDAPEGPLFSFQSEIRDFGTDEDGDPITVNIVAPAEQRPQAVAEPKLTANQKTFYRLLYDAGSSGLALDEWNAKAQAAVIGTNRKATLYDLRKALEDKSMVRESAGRWKVAHE